MGAKEAAEVQKQERLRALEEEEQQKKERARAKAATTRQKKAEDRKKKAEEEAAQAEEVAAEKRRNKALKKFRTKAEKKEAQKTKRKKLRAAKKNQKKRERRARAKPAGFAKLVTADFIQRKKSITQMAGRRRPGQASGAPQQGGEKEPRSQTYARRAQLEPETRIWTHNFLFLFFSPANRDRRNPSCWNEALPRLTSLQLLVPANSQVIIRADWSPFSPALRAVEVPKCEFQMPFWARTAG